MKKYMILILFFASNCYGIHDMAPIYTQDYCDSIEIVYGKNLLSAGGTDQIDTMLNGINLDNKALLDFGSGLGGVAFHIAEHHNCHITGVDILPSMIEHSTAQIPAHLKQKLTFQTINSNTLPFTDDSFDIIYSKEVILHLSLHDKKEVFAEFYRILKPGGVLIIVDWLSPQDNLWPYEINKLIEDEDQIIYSVSPHTYENLLKNSNFKNIKNINHNKAYIQHNIDVIAALQTDVIKTIFVTQYDEETWKLNIIGYQYILQALQDYTLLINNIYAQK